MPIYEYETIPQSADEAPARVEILQRMADAPLTVHPETGQPIRRVYASFSAAKGGTASIDPGPMPGEQSCGPGCSCCGPGLN